MSSEYTTDFYAIDSCLDFFMPPDLEKVIRNNCTQYKLFYTPFEQPLNIEFCLKENARLFNRHHHSSTLLKGDSRSPSTLNQIKTLLTDGIDLFIDGGHDYQNVIDDFENYFPFINSNGVIVFDDYHSSHNDVITAVDDICYKYKEKIYTIGCIDNIVYSKSIHSSIPIYILQKNDMKKLLCLGASHFQIQPFNMLNHRGIMLLPVTIYHQTLAMHFQMKHLN